MIKRLMMVFAMLGLFSAKGASIEWEDARAIAGDSDISLEGVQEYALCARSNLSVPLNTVEFMPMLGGNVLDWNGSVSVTNFVSVNGTDNDGNTFSAASSAFRTMIASPLTTGNFSGVAYLALNNLVPGRRYLVQIFASNVGFTNLYCLVDDAKPLRYNGTGIAGTTNVGQYIVGRFTADAVSQGIKLQGFRLAGTTANTPTVFLNAIQVRDITKTGLVWSGGSAGEWSTSAADWGGGPWVSGSDALIRESAVVSLVESMSAGSLVVRAPMVVFSGSAGLGLADGKVDVATNSQLLVRVPIAADRLSKNGSGGVMLSASGQQIANLDINAGTVAVARLPVEGLVFRADASSASSISTNSSGEVVAWSLAVPSGSVMTQGVFNSFPVPLPRYEPSAFGGRGAISFGENGPSALGVVLTLSPRTIFVVHRLTGNAPVDLGGLFGQGDLGIRVSPAGSTKLQWPGNNGNTFYYSPPGSLYVNGVLQTGSSPSGIDLGTNPAVITADKGSSVGWDGRIGVGVYYSGYTPTTQSRYYKGEVAEILVYNRTLDDSERQYVEAYLTEKWISGTAGSSMAVFDSTPVVRVGARTSLQVQGGTLSAAGLAGRGLVDGTLAGASVEVSVPSGTNVFSGIFTNAVTLVKKGAGTFAMNGFHDGTGSITVAEGRLVLPSCDAANGLVARFSAAALGLSDGAPVTNWPSIQGTVSCAFTNFLGTTNVPAYKASAFGGRGGVMFATNGIYISKTLVSDTSFSGVRSAFIVARLGGTHYDMGSIFGTAASDSGIRGSTGTTGWQYPGNNNDWCNNGLMFFNGRFQNVFLPPLGTNPHIVSALRNAPYSGRPAIGFYYFQQPKRFFSGEIAEIRLYNRELSEPERRAIEIKLARDWGIPGVEPIARGLDLAVRSGASIDLGGLDYRVKTLSGGGEILNGGIAFDSIGVSAEGGPVVSGDLSLESPVFAITDSAALADGRIHPLIRCTGTFALSGTPVLNGIDAARWSVITRSDGLYLLYKNATMIRLY